MERSAPPSPRFPSRSARHLEAAPSTPDPASSGFVRRLFVALLVGELLLVYFDVVVTYFEAIGHESIQDLCNLVLEGSLGGWLSSAQTLVVGLVALQLRRRDRDEGLGAGRVVGWSAVAAYFLYMAVDDGTGLHEAISTAIEDSARSAISSGTSSSWVLRFPSYPWHLLFLPGIALLGAFTVVFCWKALRFRRGRRWVVAGFLCFAIAVGLDFVEGLETPYNKLTAVVGFHQDAIPHTSGVVEEFVEMLGTSLILCAFLNDLAPRRFRSPC